jgi:hypothetical protein
MNSHFDRLNVIKKNLLRQPLILPDKKNFEMKTSMVYPEVDPGRTGCCPVLRENAWLAAF